MTVCEASILEWTGYCFAIAKAQVLQDALLFIMLAGAALWAATKLARVPEPEE